MSGQLIAHIKKLIPLCDIKKEENQQTLLKNILLGKIIAGKTLFYSGKNNEFTYYLLSGELSLTDSEGNISILKSEDPRCRFPVGYDQSYKYTVTPITPVNYLKINSLTLDTILTWDQTTTPLLREPGKEEDEEKVDTATINWMSATLECELFQRIPPSNIQAMFLRFTSIKAPEGTVVIEQDSEASNYFVIKSGTAAVYRKDDSESSNQQKLADLGPGDAFGEEGLVANTPRNASVIMLEDGELASLSKDNFLELLKEPVIQSLDYEEAVNRIRLGGGFIDARTENEHRHNQLDNSLNIPLQVIREHLSDLDKSREYIVYCDTGSRSAAVCYILNQHGFVAKLLENGLNSVPSVDISHPNND